MSSTRNTALVIQQKERRVKKCTAREKEKDHLNDSLEVSVVAVHAVYNQHGAVRVIIVGN